MLKNYLSVAYSIRGNAEQAAHVNEWMLKEHPDYLYGIVNKVNLYFAEGKYDDGYALLGEQLEIRELFPHRKLFHVTEVISYYATAVKYLVHIGNLDAAIERSNIIKHFYSTSYEIIYSGKLISDALNEEEKSKPKSKFQKQLEKRLFPAVNKPLKKKPISNSEVYKS